MTAATRVLLVDDDPFTRVGLTSILRALGAQVVADAATASAAVRAARQTRPDAAVIDLDLGPGPNGADLAHGLRRELPGIGIVLISTYVDPRLLDPDQPPLPTDSVFVSKRTITEPEVLARALRRACAPDLHTDATAFPQPSAIDAARTLSDQQIAILRLVAAGCSNAEIARRRSINESSVEKAVARLLRQLGLSTSKDVNARVLLAQAYQRLTGTVDVRAD